MRTELLDYPGEMRFGSENRRFSRQVLCHGRTQRKHCAHQDQVEPQCPWCGPGLGPLVLPTRERPSLPSSPAMEAPMMRCSATLILLILFSSCQAAKVSLTVSSKETITIAVEDCSVDWIEFEADYWHAPVTAWTSVSAFYDPDEKVTGHFTLVGKINAGGRKTMKFDLYESGMFGCHEPQVQPSGLIADTIRSMKSGKGKPPKGSLSDLGRFHHCHIWRVNPE